MNYFWLSIALVIALIGVLALAASSRGRRNSGLPTGEIRASDVGLEERGKPLYSARYGLTGTPDYVVETSRGTVPVEVKPTRTEEEPHQSHLLQVLAYCLLLEEQSGRKPPYGLLRYSTATFKVDYNRATRAHLLEMLDAMRQKSEEEEWEVERSHNVAGRCRACGYREVCDRSLWPEER